MNHESSIKLNLVVLILASVILNSCFLILSVSAAGIEASPAKLELILRGEEPLKTEIRVANPTADVQVFEVYADDFAESFEFDPASFTLEPGARKTVQITVLPSPRWRGNEGGVIATTISILGKPLAESRLQTATGIKIPTTIIFADGSQSKFPFPELAGTLAVVAAIIYIAFFRSKHRN